MASKPLYVNTGTFPFSDQTTGIRYEPGEHTKAEVSDWLVQQEEAGLIVPVDKLESLAAEYRKTHPKPLSSDTTQSIDPVVNSATQDGPNANSQSNKPETLGLNADGTAKDKDTKAENTTTAKVDQSAPKTSATPTNVA